MSTFVILVLGGKDFQLAVSSSLLHKTEKESVSFVNTERASVALSVLKTRVCVLLCLQCGFESVDTFFMAASCMNVQEEAKKPPILLMRRLDEQLPWTEQYHSMVYVDLSAGTNASACLIICRRFVFLQRQPPRLYLDHHRRANHFLSQLLAKRYLRRLLRLSKATDTVWWPRALMKPQTLPSQNAMQRCSTARPRANRSILNSAETVC